MTTIQILFGFRGRIGRLSFLGHNLLIGFAFVFLGIALVSFFGFSLVLAWRFALLGFVVVLWPSVALVCKRLHDMDRSGLHAVWIAALVYVPREELPDSLSIPIAVLGVLASLWVLFMPGTPGPNRYGVMPGTWVDRTPAAGGASL